jgi:hypothetical protein
LQKWLLYNLALINFFAALKHTTCCTIQKIDVHKKLENFAFDLYCRNLSTFCPESSKMVYNIFSAFLKEKHKLLLLLQKQKTP